jgi:regulatory protein
MPATRPGPGVQAQDPENPDAAFEKAVRVLNAAAQTSNGLNAKLRRAGYSARAADEACRRAVSLGYVNDQAYADALVAKRLRQGRGRRLISQELGHKGLDAELVGESIAGVDAADELQSATELAAKLVRRHAAEPEQKRRDKVLGALARRGFGAQVSRRALEEA